MDLFLLRHGVAENATARDEDRVLTDPGRADLREAARGMARMGLRFDLVLASPLARARETAEIVIEETGGDCLLSIVEELVPGSTPQKVYGALAAVLPDKGGPTSPPRIRALLVGHEPLLGEICADLMGQTEPAHVSQGTLVWFEMRDRPPRCTGRLREVLPLSKLISAGRPETP
jgi:phosphohistidine phosphatase